MAARIDDATRAQYALYRYQMAMPRLRAAKMAGVSNAWAVGFDRLVEDDPLELERLLDAHPIGDGAVRDPIPFDELTPIAKALLDDFEQWRAKVMGRTCRPWASEVAHVLAERFESGDREFVVLNAPPGVGKSTVLADVGLWLTCKHRDLRGVAGAIKSNLAERYTRRLRTEFERDTPLRAGETAREKRGALDAEFTMSQLYGRFRPLKPLVWRADGFIVECADMATRTEKEFTWLAASMEEDFIGDRVNLQMWDDPASKASSRSPEIRHRHFEQWGVVEDRLEPGGLLVLSMQRLAINDLSRFALDKRVTLEVEMPDGDVEFEERQKYHHLSFKAHDEELCTGVHGKAAQPWPEGCLLDPTGLPWRDLQGKMSNRAEYLLTYQQDDTADPDAVFKRVWIDGGREADTGILWHGCWDHTRDPGEKVRFERFLSYAAVDPSASGYWVLQHWCVAEGQMVTTARGDVPIEQVTPQDFVLTRNGWRRVQHRTLMGEKPVLAIGLSNGRTLRVTADHLVLADGEWVEAGKLGVGAELVVPRSLVGVLTQAAPIGALGGERVVPGDLVAEVAVGAAHPLADVRGADHVGPVRDGLEMGRVHARPVAAQVVELEAIRDGADQHSVGEPVGELLTVRRPACADGPVSGGLGAGPLPASVGRGDGPGLEVGLINGDGPVLGVGPIGAVLASGGVSRLDGRPALACTHVVSIDREPTNVRTYDIGVHGDHEFTVEGVIVHNCYDRVSEQRVLVDMHRQKMGANDLLDWDITTQSYRGIMEEWQQRSVEWGQRIRYWVLEQNSQQRWLSQYDWARRWYQARGVVVIGHQTYAGTKLDEKMGVEGSLPTLLQSGKVRLPGSPKGRLLMRPLVDELVHWGAHPTNDCVMAMWMAEFNLPTMLKQPDRDDWEPPSAWRPSWVKRAGQTGQRKRSHLMLLRAEGHEVDDW